MKVFFRAKRCGESTLDISKNNNNNNNIINSSETVRLKMYEIFVTRFYAMFNCEVHLQGKCEI